MSSTSSCKKLHCVIFVFQISYYTNDKPHQHCIHLCINGLFVPSKCVLKSTTISTTVAGRGNNQVSWAGCHGQAGAAGNLPGEPEWTLNNFKLIKMIIMFAKAFLTGKPFFAIETMTVTFLCSWRCINPCSQTRIQQRRLRPGAEFCHDEVSKGKKHERKGFDVARGNVFLNIFPVK